ERRSGAPHPRPAADREPRPAGRRRGGRRPRRRASPAHRRDPHRRRLGAPRRGGRLVKLLRRAPRTVVLAVGLLAIGIVLAAYAVGVLRSLDERFSIRGSTGTPTNLVVVQIDSTTFNDLRNADKPSRWPFPRRYEA